MKTEDIIRYIEIEKEKEKEKEKCNGKECGKSECKCKVRRKGVKQ